MIHIRYINSYSLHHVLKPVHRLAYGKVKRDAAMNGEGDAIYIYIYIHISIYIYTHVNHHRVWALEQVRKYVYANWQKKKYIYIYIYMVISIYTTTGALRQEMVYPSHFPIVPWPTPDGGVYMYIYIYMYIYYMVPPIRAFIYCTWCPRLVGFSLHRSQNNFIRML